MKKILLLLLCFAMALSVLPACSSESSGEHGTSAPTEGATQAGTHAPIQAETSAPTDIPTGVPDETPTEEEPTMPVEPLEIGERYFIFRIWNFEINSLDAFKNIVDTVAADGFNAIKVHIPWHHVETTAGVYEYTAFDPLINYVVREKGMKVAISLDMTRRKGDTVLSEDDIMRDPSGNLCMGGSMTGDRLQISFNSENAVSKCVAFYQNAVKHYDGLYGEDVLFYLPAFSQYAETEYWCTAEYDHSTHAVAAFRTFLKENYQDIAALNKALDTSYGSFEEVLPPSTTAGNNVGQLWYTFRHQSLKNVIDRLAVAQDEVTANSKFALQLGCVYDTVSALRGTYGVADLAEHADVVWIDDGPLMNHHFSMDYIRSVLPASVELAQEIDGPHQNGATPERYLAQGLVCFERGCTYVSAANWSIDANYETYRPVWQEISSTWLGDNAPGVVQPTESSPILEISLLDLFKKRNPDGYIGRYNKLAEGGRFVYIKVLDDLTTQVPTEPLLAYSFPGDFATEQGVKGWSYCVYTRKKLVPMTFDAANNRWQGNGSFNLVSSGSVHPDAADTAIVFTAPKDGDISCSYSLSMASSDGDGIIFYILHNGEKITIGEARNGGILVTHDTPGDDTITLSVKQGDEIAFLVNKNLNTSYDSTAVSITVEYK
ncbi:MAG: hypothetical protein E7645_00210 [Ruminococcaceae bacterium]|nr:hypothetical protein [Oscillospiraceae bacterium]